MLFQVAQGKPETAEQAAYRDPVFAGDERQAPDDVRWRVGDGFIADVHDRHVCMSVWPETTNR
ncbi:hypothetical protein [Burkholderia sp. MSh2]|uniref:hypothetical protein n=1 Tax=Burkholderia sp. MSh2 TaxID=1506588 RepID=UPI001F185205|nr:hypothetical protein [Burkholderia sp. MSh2]